MSQGQHRDGITLTTHTKPFYITTPCGNIHLVEIYISNGVVRMIIGDRQYDLVPNSALELADEILLVVSEMTSI